MLVAAATPAAARDTRPPRITSAVTKDVDGDGQVDRVRVRYSEKVGLLRGKGSVKLRVGGYTVKSSWLGSPRPKLKHARRCYPGRSIARVSRVVVVRIAEKASPDTGVTPRVVYTRSLKSGRKVTDRACNEAFSGLYRSTRDGAPPILVSASTADADSDGKLDGVRATFSEPVTHPGSSAAPFKVGVASMTVTGVDAATAAPDISVHLGEAGSPDSASRPNVTYDPAAGGAAVKDAAGNAVAAAATVSPADAAKPVLLSAVTADLAGAPGSIDRVDLTFSEPVSHPADSDGTYPLSVDAHAVASVGNATGANVPVNLTEGSPDSGAKPTVTYAAGPSTAIADAAGNQPQSGPFTATADGAAPALIAAATADQDANGRLDAVRLTFSEALNYTGQNPGPFPFTIAGRTVTDTTATNGATLTVKFGEGGSFDTGAQPQLDYAPGTGTPVVDQVALVAPAKSFAQVADGAGPAIVDAATADQDADGKLDLIHLTFSEGVVHADQAVAPFPLAVEGRTVDGVSAPLGGGGDMIDVSFAEFEYDTAARPKVSYTGGGGTQIVDSSLNPPPGNEVTPDDRAGPVVVEGQADEAGVANGQIDVLHTIWSEPIDHAADSDGSYPIAVTSPAYSIAPAGIPEALGSTDLDLPLAERTVPDRDKAPSVAYDASGPGSPVTDAAGNEAAANGTPAAAVVSAACADPHEDNATDDDSLIQASPLGTEPQAEVLCGGDHDWFQIQVSSGPVVKALVAPADAFDAQLELTDSGGTPIGSIEDANGTGQNELLSRSGLAPGTYFIHVLSPGYADGSYCIQVTEGANPDDPDCDTGGGTSL